MADTDAHAPETVVDETPKNEAGTPSTPTAQPEEKKTDNAVEELRKQLEQERMRANQLANQVQASKDAEAKAAQKKLEEQGEYKTLLEQANAKLEALEAERAEEVRRRELAEASANVFAEYDEDVKALAEDTGLSLTDTSEEGIANFKERLDKIQTRIGQKKPSANNPGVVDTTKTYTGAELRDIMRDPKKRDEYFRNFGGIAEQMDARS